MNKFLIKTLRCLQNEGKEKLAFVGKRASFRIWMASGNQIIPVVFCLLFLKLLFF